MTRPDCQRASSPLGVRQATLLARQMRDQLRPHTHDRKWRLRTYKACFTAAQALEWAREHVHRDEALAVRGLNQLVAHGLLVHVVDPAKRFRVGETRTLYFRMAQDSMLDSETTREEGLSACPGNGVSLLSGDSGNGVDAMKLKHQLSSVDRILQHTVKDLNDTRGELELAKHQVQELASQQISTFVILFVLCSCNIYFLAPWSGMGWFVVLGLAFAISTQYGWRCISLWSDLESESVLMESIAFATDGNSLAEGSIVGSPTRPSYQRSSSVISMVTKSIRSMAGIPGQKSSRLPNAPHFVREAGSLPIVETWPHRPLFICANTPVSPELVPDHGSGPVPLGKPFRFKSDLFEGTCLIRLKGSRSDDPAGDDAYFAGRKRLFQSVVQGRFAEAIPVAEVLTGHEFGRPLKNLPPAFILKTATTFIGKVSPGANIVVHTERPFVDATLGGNSQAVRGDEPGNEPNIACRTIVEDCSVFGGIFDSENVSVSRRKRLFSRPEKCQDYVFDTETVYTFEFYQNLFDAQSYSLDLGFTKIGCSSILNGQPIQWLGKLKDGRYLWSFQIWHEKLLANDTDK